jgi:branched-chain amino acid transport system ATP-binding protein
MLRIRNLTVKYDALTAVSDVSLEVRPGEIVALVGANGAGKTTVGKAVCGLVKPATGEIEIVRDASTIDLTRMPSWSIARSGIVYVPESNPIFAGLTVAENLQVAFAPLGLNNSVRRRLLEQTLEKFSMIKERLFQQAGTLSGGQRRSLSLAKAVLFTNALTETKSGNDANFKLLILDEPTHGLHPASIMTVGEILRNLNAAGLNILIIEQMASFALNLAHRGYLMRRGSIVAAGDANKLRNNPALAELYLAFAPSENDSATGKAI